MSLTKKLLSIDMAKFNEKKTATMEIKRLSDMIGEPFIIKVQEVDSERYQELQAMAFDKNGAYSLKEARKVNLLLVCAGMIEPSLSDKDLQAHFGAATPKDLADKLLKGIDATLVADKISELSNFTLGNDEKNE